MRHGEVARAPPAGTARGLVLRLPGWLPSPSRVPLRPSEEQQLVASVLVSHHTLGGGAVQRTSAPFLSVVFSNTC